MKETAVTDIKTGATQTSESRASSTTPQDTSGNDNADTVSVFVQHLHFKTFPPLFCLLAAASSFHFRGFVVKLSITRQRLSFSGQEI